MTTQSLEDRLLFDAGTQESALPPECALLLFASTLATPPTFVVDHFLQELLKSSKDESVVFVSFLNGVEGLRTNMKKLVISHTASL
jgi:hypothetical protein